MREIQSIYSFEDLTDKTNSNIDNQNAFDFSSKVIRKVCEEEIIEFITRIVKSRGVEPVLYREDTIFSDDCRREFQFNDKEQNRFLWGKLEIFKELNDTNARKEVVSIDLLKNINEFLLEYGNNLNAISILELRYIGNALKKNKNEIIPSFDFMSKERQQAIINQIINFERGRSNLDPENQRTNFEIITGNGGNPDINTNILIRERIRNDEKIQNQIIDTIVDYVEKEEERRIQKRVEENPLGQMSWKNQNPLDPPQKTGDGEDLKMNLRNQDTNLFIASVSSSLGDTVNELSSRPEGRSSIGYFFETIFKTPSRAFHLYLVLFLMIIIFVIVVYVKF